MTNVGLISAQSWSAGKPETGLLAIAYSLKHHGYESFHFLSEDLPTLGIAAAQPIQGRVDIGPAKQPKFVIGISTTTQEYHLAIAYSQFFRKTIPGCVVIGGGPHFSAEKLTTQRAKDNRSSLEVALTSYDGFCDSKMSGHNRAFDAVVIGGAQPFIDLIVKHDGKIADCKSDGLYWADQLGIIHGRGRGKAPILDEFPVNVDESDVAHAVIVDYCNQGCDFCSVSFGPKYRGIKIGAIIESLDKVAECEKFVLNDSNPFLFNLGYYRTLFDQTSEKFRSMPKTFYLDPSVLTDQNKAREILDFCHKYNVCEFSIGRDAVTEEDAQFMGTRLKGKIKEQECLDQEGRELFKFLKSASENGLRRPALHYIMTPRINRRSAEAIAAEMIKFQTLQSETTEVLIRKLIATPMPGTALRARWFDAIRSPTEYWTHCTWMNSWDESFGEGSFLLDKVEELYESEPDPIKCLTELTKCRVASNLKPMTLDRRFENGVEKIFAKHFRSTKYALK